MAGYEPPTMRDYNSADAPGFLLRNNAKMGIYQPYGDLPRYQWCLEFVANLFAPEVVRLPYVGDYGRTRRIGVVFCSPDPKTGRVIEHGFGSLLSQPRLSKHEPPFNANDDPEAFVRVWCKARKDLGPAFERRLNPPPDLESITLCQEED